MDIEQIRRELEKAESDLLVLEKFGGRENVKDRKFLEGRIATLKEMLNE